MTHYSNDIASSKLLIVTALACEARPLIDRYQLKKSSQHTAFTVYQNREQTINLIVSGIGKIAAATATSYLFAATGALSYTTFLNLGLAGSGNYPIGNLYAANKIIDAQTKRADYPNNFILPYRNTANVMTFDCAQAACPENVLVDMEASSFFQAANTLVTKEHIHCLKVVSDQGCNTPHAIAKQQAIDLISQQHQIIDTCIQQLLTISAKEAELSQAPLLQAFLQRWHFSHYQQHELKELLRRWQVILTDQSAIDSCQTAHSANAVLQLLTEQLTQANYTW